MGISLYTWGKVSPEELERRFSPHDTSAVADVLFDIGTIVIDKGNFSYTLTRHIRYKIYKDSGKDYANVKIPYWHEESVINIGARTYLNDGTVIKLKNKDIFEEGDKKGVMYKVFAIPGVQSNCVVEYKYTLNSEYISLLDEWVFQNDLFTEFSRLSIEIPRGFNYNAVTKNSLTKDYTPTESIVLKPNNTKNALFTWEFEGIPPFIKEPYMTAVSNFLTILEFQLVSFKNSYIYYEFVSTWDDLSEKVLEIYDPFLHTDRKVENLAHEIIGDERYQDKKIELIYNYVRDSIVTTEYKGLYSSEIRNPTAILKTGSGSRVEKNLLTLSLLQSVGIDAEPLLISLRSHGLINEIHPRLRAFNHLLVYAETYREKYFLDTWNKYYPLKLLPSQDISYRGLLLRKAKTGFMDIPQPTTRSSYQIETDCDLDSAGNLVATSIINFEDYRNAYYRSRLDKSKDENEFIDDYIVNDVENSTVDSFKVLYSSNIDTPMTIEISFSIDNFADLSGDYMYVPLSIFSRLEENIFKLEKRTYPIDYNYPRYDKEKVVMNLPEGFTVSEIPSSTTHTVIGHEFNRRIYGSGNLIPGFK